MDFLTSIFQTIVASVSVEQIVLLLHKIPFAYIISLALFCCLFLVVSVFSSYKILDLKTLIAWLLSCVATFIYLVNGSADMESGQFNTALHSQVILSCASTIMLLIFYLLGLISDKPYRRGKNFGYHTWWVNIVRFIVLFAFCCIFNIGLFVTVALFYL